MKEIENVEKSYERLVGVFGERREYRKAIQKLRDAEKAASCKAPAGFLLKITATADGALTRVYDSHKRNPWYDDLPAGSITYTYEIDAARADGFTTSTIAKWAELPGPVGNESHMPVIINNTDFTLGLIAIEEYRERRLSGDRTLHRLAPEEIAQTV